MLEEVSPSVLLCSMQQFTYALCSCVQLLTLASITMERFQTIAFPFHNEKTKTRIRGWNLFGLLLAILSLALARLSVLHDVPSSRSRTHGPVWRVCFGSSVGLQPNLIVIHYVRIFKVVRQHANKVFDRGIQLRPSVSRHIWSGQNSVSEPRISLGHTYRSLPAAGASWILQLPRCTVITVSESSTSAAEAVCLLTPTTRERGQKRMEGKLAKRFGYIVITFTLFWMPMVVILLIPVIVMRGRDSQSWVLRELEASALILTCVPAAVDPLIYTMVTRQFRSEFSKLLSSLHCRG